MYLIKEIVRGRPRFGTEVLPEIGKVNWGRNGENVLEVPDDLGRKLIIFGRKTIFREVKFPSPVAVEVPSEPVAVATTKKPKKLVR